MSFRSVLFAAGKGTRMRPLSDFVPKPALPLLDVPLAAYSMQTLVKCCAAVALNVSHLAHEMQVRLGPYAGEGVELCHEAPEPYGGGGTLHALRERLRDPVVTHNGDVLADVDAPGMLESHAASDADATIAVRPVERNADFTIDDDGRLRLVARSVDSDAPGLLFLGVAVLSRAAIDLIPPARPIGLAETVLGPLAEKDRLALHVHDGYWRDVGTPGAYVDASVDVLEGRAPQPPVGFRGEVRAVEGGRAYVGRGCVVDGASLGPGAVVLEGATVGAGARVEAAVVFPGERVPARAVLSRCVWARGERIAAAATGP